MTTFTVDGPLGLVLSIHDDFAQDTHNLATSHDFLEDAIAIRVVSFAAGVFQTVLNAGSIPICFVTLSVDCLSSRTFSPELLYTFAKVQLVYLCTIVTAPIASIFSAISPEVVYNYIEFQMHARRAVTYIFTETLPELTELSTYHRLRPIAERLERVMTPDNPDRWRDALYQEIMRQNSDPAQPMSHRYFSLYSDRFENAFDNCCRVLEGHAPLPGARVAPPARAMRDEPLINKLFGEKLLECMKEARLELIEREIFSSEDIETMLGESYPAVIELGLLKLLMTAEIEEESVLVFGKDLEDELRINNDVVLFGQRNKLLEIIHILQLEEMDGESLEALTNLVSRKKMENREEDFTKEVYPHVKQAFDEIVGVKTRTIDTHFINNHGVSAADRIHWIEAFNP